jgi:hypothetical protein
MLSSEKELIELDLISRSLPIVSALARAGVWKLYPKLFANDTARRKGVWL